MKTTTQPKTTSTTTRARAPKGGLTINGRFYRGGCYIPAPTPTAVPMPAAAQVTKPAALDLVALVRRLDRTGFNLVPLHLLRVELELCGGLRDRAAQDRLILAARRAGKVSLGAFEGGYGRTTPEQLAACIRQGEDMLGFASVRLS